MGAVMSVLRRYSALRRQFSLLLASWFRRLTLRMGGWPPDPAWMRAKGPWLMACLAVPVLLSARKVLLSASKNTKSNTLLDDFVKKELNRRLVSLREILEEEKMRVERKKLKEAKAAEADKDGVQTGDASNTVSEPTLNEDSTISVLEHEKAPSIESSSQAGGDSSYDSEEVEAMVRLSNKGLDGDGGDESSDFDSGDDEGSEIYFQEYQRDEDTPIKVSDIVMAVNQVTQLDRRAPEVADGWILAAAAMARELPEAVKKTRAGEEEEWRNGDKLRDLFHRARRLELVLDANSRGYWKRITNPWGGIKSAYYKDAAARKQFLDAAASFREPQDAARLLLEQRDKTSLGKGLSLLWQYKQEIPLMAVSTLFMMLEGAVSAFPQHYQATLVSVVTGRFMKSLTGGENTVGGSAIAGRVGIKSSLVDVLMSLLVSHCCSTLIRLLAEKIASMSNRRIGLKMQVDVYHSILQQDIEYWDVHDTDEAFETLWSSADCVDDIMRFPNDILQTLSQVMSTGFILYGKNPKLLGIMMLLSPAQMIVQHYIGCLDSYVYRRAWKKNINSRSDWGEVLDPKNFRTVRSFVREPREVQMFSRELEQETETKATTSAIRSLFEPVQNIVSQMSELLGLYYGGSMVVSGKLQAGDLISFIHMAQGLSWTLRQLIHVKDELYESLDPAGRVYDLLAHKPKIGLYGGIKPKGTLGALTFEGVEFSYPSRPDVKVLRGASFTVKGGTMCALVGPSGSGKSTVLSLVERFYDPSAGRVTLDGIDIKDLDPCWLRSQMAIVSQEPVLFSVSIRENLIYGCEEEPSQETIEQACKDANIYDFITKKCPNKWRTQVGEGGSEISVGQKQRIAIARALLKNPKILLLDEATSALDSESEVLVQQALDRLMANRTTLVVAHRLSTIRDADKIVAIKHGCVHEEGTHNELITKKGLYYSYVRKQRLLRFGQMGDDGEDVGYEMDKLDAKEEAVSKEVDILTATGREIGTAMGQGEYIDKSIENRSGGDSALDSNKIESVGSVTISGNAKRLLVQKYPMLSPVTEVEGSPTYLPSSSATAQSGRITPMDTVSLGLAASSVIRSGNSQTQSENVGRSTVTVFGLEPYRDRTSDSKSSSSVVIHEGSSSAPPTPVRRSSSLPEQLTLRKSARSQTSKVKPSHISDKRRRAVRFYRSTVQLKKRFDALIKAETAGDSEAKLGSQVDRNSLKEIMDDFGDVLKLFAPSSTRKRKNNGRRSAETKSKGWKQTRPSNAKRPIMRQRSTPTTTRGRSTGWRSVENTPDRSNRKLRNKRSMGGFSGDDDMSASAWSSEDDLDVTLAPVPLRQTRSFGV